MRKQVKILCSNPQSNENCKIYHKGRSNENLCRSCSAKINFNDIRTGKTYEEYLSTKSEFKQYRIEVNKYTNQQPIYLLENYEKRGLAGVEGAYHLDHIYSVKQGFVNNVSAEIVGSIKNLRFIPWEDNIKKSGHLTNESWDMFAYFIEEGTI